ncbi:MAG: FtsX-like permease family protein [Acidobacteria bacterium]|nr:FtsX-like permease family protein [Acidobacteriota bacterium]
MNDDRKTRPGNVSDEVAFHLEMRTRELIEQGMDPAEARAEARRKFGDVREVTAATLREDDVARKSERRWEFLGELRQDVQVGFRRLIKAPGFSALAILILALGIGANSAIFSVLNTVVLQPLPYEDPGQMVQVWESSPARGWDFFSVSELNYIDFRDANETFAALTAIGFGDFNAGSYTLQIDDEYVVLDGRRVSVEFFDVLGVQPRLGRVFTEAEDTLGNESRLAILGDRLWRNRFGADEGVLGESIIMNDEAFTVVGVMPPGHFFFDDADVYTPMRPGMNENRSDHRLVILGRMHDGVTVEQAEADLDAVAAQLAVDYPDSNGGWDTRTQGLYDSIVSSRLRESLWVVAVAVGMVLLIACANLSSLLLARATARQREIAIYGALGAGRARIIRQMLTETTLLALIGGAAGTALAFRAVGWFRALDPGRLPRFETLAVDGAVLAFALGATMLTAILAGLLPAWHATSGDPQEALKDGGRGASANAGTRRLRHLLLGAEVALSIVLLVGAGLLIRSLWSVQAIDPGLESDPVLTFRINMPFDGGEQYNQVNAQFRQMLDEIQALPGVTSAATISGLPFGGGATSMDMQVEGVDHGENFPSAFWRLASPDYFETMGIPLVKGRNFLPEEADGRNLAIISESMANALWPDQDPIGKRFFGWRDPERQKTVIGVVGDVRERNLETEATNLIYMPHLQMSWWSNMYFVIKTDGVPSDLAPSVRATVTSIVPDQPILEVLPLRTIVEDSLGPRRFNASLLMCFAALALVLAAAGVYGVMAYSVAQRTNEIGIRMAIGAGTGNVLGMVVRQGMGVVAAGVIVGTVASIGAARQLASMLFGVETFDPLSLTGAVVFLSAVALVACVVPALRATRVHPTEALRDA